MELPGIERYPDLRIGLRRELSRVGCGQCDRVAVIQKYVAEIAKRDAGQRAPQNTLESRPH
jgi:hypothetical protein